MRANPENNSLRKRIKRYAKVSSAAVVVGARRYLSQSTNIQKQAETLRIALGTLKGPIMKVAQILATIPDVIPKEYAEELSQLQADAPSMGWPFVKRRMAAELGADWQKKFKSFDQTASAAASLGQVHKATSLDGKQLACKLQYPDMQSVVEADLKQLKIILAVFEHYDRAVSTREAQKEIADRMREELDYVREAKHIKLYAHMLKNTPCVHVPEVKTKLSTDRLLTMTWLDGDRLVKAAEKKSLNDRNEIAMNMFHAWYSPLYSYGVIHGDPHLGNYTVRDDNGINLLDFGCVRIFTPELVRGIIMLYHSLIEKKPELSVEAYKAWGFKNPDKALVDILNIWSSFIYAPLLEDKTRSIEETNTGIYGRETANRMHRELRKIGGISVPREFVFMDRAAIGLGSVFLRLRAEINWHRVFNEMIKDFNLTTLATRQHKALILSGLEK